MKRPLDCRLYAIVDVGPAGLAVGPEVLAAALAAGVTLLQVRGKQVSPRALRDATRAVTALAHARGVAVLVNDRPDVAAAAGADGVHLGQSDVPATVIRRLWPDLRVGLSVHDEAELRAALSAGVDYVAAGSLYPTGSKNDATPLEHALFRRLAEESPRPLVGIGGITPERAPEVAALGAAGVAVISGLWGAANPAEAARHYRRAFP